MSSLPNPIHKVSKIKIPGIGKRKPTVGSCEPTISLLLHGYLELEIKEARCLPNMETWISGLINKGDVTDAFVEVKLGKAKLLRTNTIDNELHPVWNESYKIDVCHFAEYLKFNVWDKDHAYSEYIGSVLLATSALRNEEIIQGWFPILKRNGQKIGEAELNIKAQFISKEQLNKTYEVDCYFPMRKNCFVTLYQDSHALDIHQMPQFNLMAQQMPHLSLEQVVPKCCWKDIYHSFIGAQKIICITGWAVWHGLKLLRGADENIDQRTLGEILVDKAQQGVQVYVMTWSEITTGDFGRDKGFMGTHDMETFNYFRDTPVQCAIVPRETCISELSDVAFNLFSNAMYSHHQKSVICDADGPMHYRRLIAFVGGLDLTDGRYDTPNHELYSTLLNEHANDFRNKNANSVPPTQGPREPWHDIHCKVEGPIANDVFLNFHERWSKQGEKFGHLRHIDRNIIETDLPCTLNDPTKEWCCQLFRSITSDSAHFNHHFTQHFNKKKNKEVDTSIARAYIQMIRNAENFIYIENQYFYGSAFCWNDLQDANCHHIIPSEIAQKIVEKIILNQRFTAYIVIPMFPEGDPSSIPMQEQLNWQYKTMQMMYERIGEAIRKYESNSHPTDWLLFMCLGKRDAAGEYLDRLEEAKEASAKLFRKSLRFPIYVHSKMMIVDDAYIIVGSANINERSLSGTRDTEMAIGCWQPHFDANNPYGDVHTFRMSLWTEHFRHNELAFIHPGSIECVRKVKEYTSYNWKMYTGPTGSVTPGQILGYPLHVMPDGQLRCLEGVDSFPDFPAGSKITGKGSLLPLNKVTT